MAKVKDGMRFMTSQEVLNSQLNKKWTVLHSGILTKASDTNNFDVSDYTTIIMTVVTPGAFYHTFRDNIDRTNIGGHHEFSFMTTGKCRMFDVPKGYTSGKTYLSIRNTSGSNDPIVAIVGM